tara:strand:- start:1557 stop:1784 length:228 start_codon:yes stop_codon:yes gene_type:complete
MPKRNCNSRDVKEKMMFDLIYQGMSDKDIAAKYSISESKLRTLKNSKIWKSNERKMWDKMISALIFRRNIKAMTG